METFLETGDGEGSPGGGSFGVRSGRQAADTDCWTRGWEGEKDFLKKKFYFNSKS